MKGFLLAGGAALLAQQLTTRPTRDLDFFTGPQAGDVRRTCAEFVTLGESRAWTVETIRDGETLCRLLVHGPEDLLVDIALDSAPGRPPTVSLVGPTFAVEELAGHKVVALFDRAAARDFVDAYMLAQRSRRTRSSHSRSMLDSTGGCSPRCSPTSTATAMLTST